MTAADRREWMEIAIALLWGQLQLRIRPFRRVVADFEPAEPGDAAPPVRTAAERAQTTARVRHRVAHLVPRLPLTVACLGQALAAAAVLRRRGCDVRMYLGTTAPTDGFAAHAWLCSEGVVVTGAREAEAFTAVASFLGRARDPR